MKLSLIAVVAILLTAPAAGQTPTAPPPGSYGAPISIETATWIIERGRQLSAQRGFKMAIAIVEPSGELVAFARMTDAPYASTRLAQQKARTAARLRVSTANLEERVLGGRSVLMSSDEVVAIGGGVPIVENGRVVGAIGVSGATAAQDAEVATAALGER